MSQSGKLMPNLDQESTKLLNLTVLRRIDPFVEEILITAAHVTFYEFNIELSQWSRKDVEGSLFVVKRTTQPRFQFIVMNRRNTDNLIETILGDFEFEVHSPYLLYRNAAQEVNGIWFYNKRECEENEGYSVDYREIDIVKYEESVVASGSTINVNVKRILNAYSKVPQMSKVAVTGSEFEELEAVPSMAVIDGPLEPPSSTATSRVDTPDDPSFMNFFSGAMTIGNASGTAVSTQAYQPTAAISTPLHPVSAAPPVQQTVSALQSSSTPFTPILEPPESSSNSNRITSLLKPSSFFVPPSSVAQTMPPLSMSLPTAPPLPVPLQRPYGAPLLQPFPPPNPPPSLTPASAPTQNYGPVISREKVRDALLVLVQDDQFIDMVHQALQNAHKG